MKSFQRMGGKMMKRSDDQQDVGTVIAEFKSTENMLDRLARDLKSWRDSWDDVLKFQSDAAEAFLTLYKPISLPTDVEVNYRPAETPRSTLQRSAQLHKTYFDARADLQQELTQIHSKIIRPVEEAKMHMKGMQRTLKHRENMKLDYERYQSRAEHARKKEVKSPKDQISLAKCENELTQAKIDYQSADEQVKQTFPPVTDAVLALMPYLLAAQVMLQTTLVGQLYTLLDAFCKQQGLPSPAPSDAEIVAAWDQDFTGLRREAESGLKVLAGGKAVHMNMKMPEQDGSTVTGLGLRNKAKAGVSSLPGLNRTKSDQPLAHRPAATPSTPSPGYAEEEEEAPPKPPRPGQNSSAMMASKPRISSTPSFNRDSKPSPGGGNGGIHAQLNQVYGQQAPPAYSSSGGATPPSAYATPTNGLSPSVSHSSISQRADYFDRKPSASSLSHPATTPGGSPWGVVATASAAAAKKKPPPPVPVKRIASQGSTFVTALFDFAGQSEGDLSFREGEKIRVVKRTERTDDWWTGEVNGRTGHFPANYVEL